MRWMCAFELVRYFLWYVYSNHKSEWKCALKIVDKGTVIDGIDGHGEMDTKSIIAGLTPTYIMAALSPQKHPPPQKKKKNK